MKITEKMLLDGYTGKTNGGSNISEIAGEKIYWDYRTGEDKYNDGSNCVTSRISPHDGERAGEITLGYNRVGTIDLDDDCDEHPTIARIEREEAEMWGDQVKV